jgi:germination protein M
VSEAPPSAPASPPGQCGAGPEAADPRRSRRRWLAAAAVSILAAAGVFLALRRGGGEAEIEPAVGQAIIVDEEAPLADPTRSAERQVVLFFAHENSDGLVPERRSIYVTSSLADQARQVIEGLIRGPRRALSLPVLPREAGLRDVYVDREGNAYVDFSAELTQRHPGGTEAEIASLYAVVNSLTYNFEGIRSVRILIDGEERETLAGHIDLTRRYYRDMSRLAPEALQGLEGGDDPRASR